MAINTRNFVRFIASFAVAMLTSVYSYGQNLNVMGTVKDSSGQPVIGAAVLLDGVPNVGVITDINGKYTISIPQTAKSPSLSFSCMGFKTQSISVSKRAIIDVVMEEDSEFLEEVVVVGYGSMRRSDLTGSVASVKIDEEEAAKTTSIDQLLIGHAAGVDVISSSEGPDSGVSIRIRGITSINGSSEPLYVMDGIILTDASPSSLKTDEDEEVNGLLGLNPQDIASIEILKDASATAIYGAAGANGVVLITTKQANREKPTVQFNLGYDISEPYRKIDVLDYKGYTRYLEDRTAAGESNGLGILHRMYKNYDTQGAAELNSNIRIRNWQEDYLRNAPRQRYYLSVSGKPNTMSYSLSLGYNKSEGIVSNTDSEQFTARINIEKKFFKNLRVGTKTNLAYITSHKMQGAGSGDNSVSSSFIKSLVSYRPFISLKQDEDEEYEAEDEMSQSSPSKWINDSYQIRNEYRITPSIYASYAIAPWVDVRTSFGADYRMRGMDKFKGITVSKSPASGGVTYGQTYSWNWDTTVNLKKKFKKHNLSGTIGFTMNRYHSNNFTTTSKEISQYAMGVGNIDSSVGAITSYSETQTAKMSAFLRAIYNYNERYVVTATFRADGSSLFPKKNKFAFFPSVAAAWRINQERWFNSRVISTFKLRLGWGQVGNCSMSPYQYMSTFGRSSQGYHFNDADYITAIAPNVFANDNLKWETTSQVNVGLDYAMWKGRLSLSVDAYYKMTDDLLQKRYVTYNTGFSQIWVNQGRIENKGIELNLEATPVSIRDFEWTLSGNISFNRNTLRDIGFDATKADFYFEPLQRTEQQFYPGGSIGAGGYLGSSPLNIFMLGQPIGLMYGYRTDGIVQEGEFGVPVSKTDYENGKYALPGSIKYVDMNGNGYIDVDDRTIIGNANPKFIYGFSTTFSWNGLRLSADFQGSYGGNLYNANRMQWTDSHRETTPINILSEAFNNRWTLENPSGRYVAISDAYRYYGNIFNEVFSSTEHSYVSDRDVEDASYLRLASLSLSYTFNLPKKSPLRRISLGVSGRNLFIWTAYSGFSPIVSSYKISSQRIGIDSGGYPSARTYCFDLKFTF